MLTREELQDAGYVLSHGSWGWRVYGYEALDWDQCCWIDARYTPFQGLPDEVARQFDDIHGQQALTAANAHYRQQVESIVWHEIKTDTIVDGPGERTALYVVGCAIRCPGCHSSHLWEPGPGTAQNDAQQLAQTLLAIAGDRDLTLTGGEPLMQARPLLRLVAEVRRLDARAGKRREILMYTGFAFEDWTTLGEVDPEVLELLLSMDFVVEGPYDPELANQFIQYRGSSNQRVVDIAASITAGKLVDVSAQWDRPEVLIPPFRPMQGSEGLMTALFPGPGLEETWGCGQAT